jgi:hypothetical protein
LFGSSEPICQVSNSFLCCRHQISPFARHRGSLAHVPEPYSPYVLEVDVFSETKEPSAPVLTQISRFYHVPPKRHEKEGKQWNCPAVALYEHYGLCSLTNCL